MSGCGCVYVDVDVLPEFHEEREPRARKKHICDECGRTIEPGEKYERVVGKWDGDVSVNKTCSDCLSIRDSFFCAGYGYGRIFEHLWEHIWNLDGEISSDCLVPLTPRARENVCEMIEEIWAEIELGEEDYDRPA